MARGLNKVTLIGALSREPEIRYTSGGKRFITMRVCTPRNWTTSEGEHHQETEQFDVTAWGPLAEVCHALSGGCQVYVTGRLQTRSWDDLDGRRQSCCVVVANHLLVLADTPGAGTSELHIGVNSIMLIGNLGRDPEIRYTAGGKPVTSFSLATSRNWVTSDGQRREETEWFNVVSWGNLAEICHRYLGRGSRVYIEGRLQTREWDDAGGLRRRRTEVVADEMIRLDSRGGAPTRRDENVDQPIGGDFTRDPSDRTTAAE